MDTKYDPLKVIELIEKHKGNVSQVAKALKCSRDTIHNYIKDNPEIKQALTNARETMTDIAESKLQSAIQKGELTAIIFYLKTQGKSRGYVERQELTGADGEKLIPVLKTGMNVDEL